MFRACHIVLYPRRPRGSFLFSVKVFCKIETSDLTENFHHEHFIDPTNCPWVSEDDSFREFLSEER